MILIYIMLINMCMHNFISNYYNTISNNDYKLKNVISCKSFHLNLNKTVSKTSNISLLNKTFSKTYNIILLNKMVFLL
jgi:hypothetical protein